MSKLIATALLLGAVSSSLFSLLPAEAKGWGVNAREARQQRRICNGVQNGSLTGREAGRMERRQAKLDRQENRMRASGGGLSNKERARLEHEQNNLSRGIYNNKHDGQHQ